MFWNASELRNIFPHVNYYPQLMAMDISNCHGRLNNNLISKVNIYNTLTDKLQKEKDGIAFKFLNIGKSICDLAKLGNGKGLDGFLKVISDFKVRREKLEKNVISLMNSKIGTRAEFRINFKRIYLTTIILQRLFSGEYLNQKVIYLSSESVADWSLITIQMLCAPISSSLALAATQFKEGNYDLFEQSVVTISAFESLLCSTFFTGMPYSYASSIIWKKSNGPNLMSIELMKAIKTYNRIVIPESFWLERCLAIRSLQFSDIIQKIATIERFGLMANFNLVRILINPSNNPLDEAIAIWKSYFDCLNDNDFTDGIDRWKCSSVIDERKFTINKLQIQDCIEKIFNVERLLIHQTKWKRFFLLAFSDWIDFSRKNNLKERIKSKHSILETAALKLGVELVHYFGDSSLSFYGTSGRYIRVVKAESDNIFSRQDLISPQPILVNRQVSVVPPINPRPDQRKKSEFFSGEEIVDLIDGYNKYCSDRLKWSKILSDPGYCFLKTKNRIGEQLKDKFRNLERKKDIIFENGVYSLNSSESRERISTDFGNQVTKFAKFTDEQRCSQLPPLSTPVPISSNFVSSTPLYEEISHVHPISRHLPSIESLLNFDERDSSEDIDLC